MLDYYFDSLDPERAAPVGVSSFGRRINAASLERIRGQLARSILKRAEATGATHLWVFEARPGKAATLATAFDGELELVGSRYVSRDELSRAIQLVADGHVRLIVDQVLPLAKANEAFELLEQGGLAGRVVLDVAGIAP